MVEKIDKVGVKMGRLIRVKNTTKKKFSSEDEWYYALPVENANGKGERTLLFTEEAIADADERAVRKKEIIPKKSFWRDFFD